MESFSNSFVEDYKSTKTGEINDLLDCGNQDLFTRDALGTAITEIFGDVDNNMFGIPLHCSPQFFNLCSVFVKDKNTFVYVGNLGHTKGGILREGALQSSLRPHLHRSMKRCVDQYLTVIKHPFTSKTIEFASRKLSPKERPEGKLFSWLDMGMAQLHYISSDKLSIKLTDCVVDMRLEQLKNVKNLYIVYKNCLSEKLAYYSSVPYQCTSWLGKDVEAIEKQIKNITKNKPCIEMEGGQPRAFGFCKVSVSKSGKFIGSPVYNIALIPPNPYKQSADEAVFNAEELDFDFVSTTISKLKSMKTKETLQSALRDIYVNIEDYKERRDSLLSLRQTIKKFQTDEASVIQMVDCSLAIPSIPPSLGSNPTILSRILRAAGIVLTASSSQDSDDEEKGEEQIIFQPMNCQEYLRDIECVLTILIRGILTDDQCMSACQLLEPEIFSLQELYHTQMCCICSPWKSLNPKEEPIASLWKKGTKTRQFLETVGLKEETVDDQKIVLSPDHSQLLNVLSLFYMDI